MTLGARLRACRKNAGLSLSTLSAQCGFSIAYLSDIERDKSEPPIATIREIARSLGVRSSMLIGDSAEAEELPLEWRIIGRTREIVESTVRRAQGGEWISIDPIFLQWLWADFLKLEAMVKEAE